MDNFIQITDYDASIHRDILDAVTRSDAESVEICEDRAVAEMRGYLGGRYDVDAIFGARGEERHPLVLMFALDIAIYHLFSIHNPQKMSQIRVDRYNRAMEWLKQVARQEISVEGAPEREDADVTETLRWQFRSEAKRVNRL